MGGRNKKTTTGYWYKVAYHHGLGIGPIDAFLEIRGGDKTAWTGELTQSGSIHIDARNLWGGEKDQGGIVGDVDVMFGEAEQQPNGYLLETFGTQQPAWRGLATLVFKGGLYGAMNPYPQRPSYKIRKIKAGWDTDCWYPETAEVTLLDGAISMLGDGWEYQVETFTEPNTVWNDYTVPTSGWSMGGDMPFSTNGMSGGLYWTPTRSNIWLRRRMRVNTAGLTMNIGADNGCVVWVDGMNVGSSNPENEPIPGNQSNPVSFTFGAMGEVEVIVKAFAEISPSHEAGNVVNIAFSGLSQLAMNPAHILYYALTQSGMGREPAVNLNEGSFSAAADWFHSQGLGLCTSYDPKTESVDEFVRRICNVAGCSLTRSLLNGQWYLDIANGVYSLGTLPVLTDDDVLAFEEHPTIIDSAVNSVSVTYFDPLRKETITTAPVQAPAAIDEFGPHHLSLDYPEIPDGALALRVAQRELRARITPLRVFQLKTTRKPYAWRPGTYFRLQLPKRGITDMVCILGEKSSGQLRSGAISITATQDVFTLPETSFVQVEHGVDTARSSTPLPIVQQRVFEAPYAQISGVLSHADLAALPNEAGYLLSVASDPGDTRDYTLLTAPDGGAFDVAGYGDWTPTATVVEAASRLDTTFTLTAGKLLDQVPVGSAALWDDEIVRVDTLNAGSGTITLARGCADTVPQVHEAGRRLWFYDVTAAVDPTEYTDGETVQAKLLDNTGSAQYPADTAAALTLTFNQRQYRPYPPGQFLINGETYPESAVGPTPLAITWAHRDRVQQADMLIDTGAATIGPESGVTYTVRGYENDVLAHTESGISGSVTSWLPSQSATVRIELESVRGGVASWQFHSATLGWTAALSDAVMAGNVLDKLKHWWPLGAFAVDDFFRDEHGGMDLRAFSNAGAGIVNGSDTIRVGGGQSTTFSSAGGAFVHGKPSWMMQSYDISVVMWLSSQASTTATARRLVMDSGSTDSGAPGSNFTLHMSTGTAASPQNFTFFWEYSTGTDYATTVPNALQGATPSFLAFNREMATTAVSVAVNDEIVYAGTFSNGPSGGNSETVSKLALANMPGTTVTDISSSEQAANASIQDFALFQPPLNSDEIAWLYNAGHGRSYAALVAIAGRALRWTPTQLGRKVVWAVSDDPQNLVSSGLITEIANRAGFMPATRYSATSAYSGKHGAESLNGRPVITGDATNTAGFVFTNTRYERFRSVNGISLIAVVKKPAASPAGTGTILAVTREGSDAFLCGLSHSVSGGATKFRQGGRRLSADSFTSTTTSSDQTGEWVIAGGFNDYSSGEATIRENGVQSASNASAFSTGVTSNTASRNKDCSLGITGWGTEPNSNYAIAEFLIIDGKLTTDEWQKLEGYLAHEWGLTAKLPSDHPYKSLPPTLSTASEPDQSYVSQYFAPMGYDGVRLFGVDAGVTGPSEIIYSSDGGATWTLEPAGPTHAVDRLIYGLGVYVAHGAGNWFSIAPSLAGPWTSEVIVDFPVANVGGGIELGSLLFDGSRFVVSGEYGIIMTRTDVSGWVEIPTHNLQAGTTIFRSMDWDGSAYYAVVSAPGVGLSVWKSSDLATWTQQRTVTTYGANMNALKIRCVNGRVFVLGVTNEDSEPMILSSGDAGATWTDTAMGQIYGANFSEVLDIAYFNSLYVIFGNRIEGYSADASSWTTTLVVHNLSRPVQVGGTLFALHGGLLRYTTDGMSWSDL